MDNDELRRQTGEAFDRIRAILDGKHIAVVTDVVTALLANIVLCEPKEAQKQCLATLIDIVKDKVEAAPKGTLQ